MAPAGTLMTTNWRTKLITEIDREGKVVKQFTSPELNHPALIAVNNRSDVIVADNEAKCLFVFDNTGRYPSGLIMACVIDDDRELGAQWLDCLYSF